jgi:predicted regulator of Ras-like GTPase activity (Roadblock/LC7/MglB family)
VTKAEAMAAALNEFLDVSWEVEAAAVVSPDGLPMASALPPDVEEDRLAAMSASLLTLGERAAEGLDKGQLAQVLVEGEQGYVLLMSAGPDALLVAVMSREAKVGLVRFEMRRAAASIAAVMDGSYRQAPAPPAVDQPAGELSEASGGEPVAPAPPAAEAAYAEPATEGAGTAAPAPEAEVASPFLPEPERAAPAAADSTSAESGGAWSAPVEDLRIESPAEARWSEPIETSQEPPPWAPAPADAPAEPASWSPAASEVGTAEPQAPAWERPVEPEAPSWERPVEPEAPGPTAETDSGEQGTHATQERSGSVWDRAAAGGGAAGPDPGGTPDPERDTRGWRHWRSSRPEDADEHSGSEEPTKGPVGWLESPEQEDDSENPASTPTWK